MAEQKVAEQQVVTCRDGTGASLWLPLLVFTGLGTCHNTSVISDNSDRLRSVSFELSSIDGKLREQKELIEQIRGSLVSVAKGVGEIGNEARDGASTLRNIARNVGDFGDLKGPLSDIRLSLEALQKASIRPGQELQDAVAEAIRMRLSMPAADIQKRDSEVAALLERGGIGLAEYAWVKASAEIRDATQRFLEKR